MSVQHRTAEDADRAPTRRRLTFSTPLSASLVAVVVIAVVAAAILLGPRGIFGIGSASPSPGTPTPIPSPTLPLESPTVAPTASPSLTPTIAPTPSPASTPAPVAWTGLEWASGPSLPLLGDGMFPRIGEVTWWGGRYFGVGSITERGLVIPSDPGSESDLRIAPAFFAAEAGSDWRLVQQGEWHDAAVQDADRAALAHLVDLGDQVVAISGDSPMDGDPPSLWSSTDGLSWSLVDSASWTEIWGLGTYLWAVDGGSSGIVAIGFDGGGCCLTPAGRPLVAFAPDGRTWQRISPQSMTDRASLADVAATDAGFVIVGAARGPEDPQAHVPAEVGAPAAWVSSDGQTWEAAQVDGAEVVGGRLMHVAIGADGLYATGVAEANPSAWEGTHGWSSTDGRVWTLAGALGTGLLPGRVIVSDGERMIGFGAASPTTTDLAAWVSTNGMSWNPLAFSGITESLPLGAWEEGRVGVMPAISAAWMVPDGVLISDTFAPRELGQAFWFGTAVQR